MKKLVIISPFFLIMKRGIEQFTFHLTNEILKNNSMQIIIYTWECKNPVKWPTFHRNLKIRKVPYFRYYRKILAIIFYKIWIILDKPQKKILNFLWHGESSVVNKNKDIIVFHNPYDQIPDRYEFSRTFINSKTRVVLNSKDSLNQYNKFNMGGNIARFIYTGVDPKYFIQDKSIKNRFDSNCLKLICISSFEKRKGIQYLLYSMPTILKDLDVELKIIGSGICDNLYKEIISEKSLENHVRILPPVNDTKKHLLDADIYFLLSKGEGFPLGLLEAMSCGIPSVTSSYPPFDEIDNDAIIKVDINDPIQIKNALKTLSDEGEYKKFSSNSRNYILKNHSWEIIARKYLDVLYS